MTFNSIIIKIVLKYIYVRINIHLRQNFNGKERRHFFFFSRAHNVFKIFNEHMTNEKRAAKMHLKFPKIWRKKHSNLAVQYTYSEELLWYHTHSDVVVSASRLYANCRVEYVFRQFFSIFFLFVVWFGSVWQEGTLTYCEYNDTNSTLIELRNE